MRTENILISVRGIKIKAYSEKKFIGKKHHPKEHCVKKQCTTLKMILYSYLKSLP